MGLTFDQAFDRLISHEGGYVNNPNDPGGETKFGISKRSYPNLNIAKLDIDTARAIYRADFWDLLGENAHPAIRFQAFDFAVNSGITTALRKLQSAIGVADDGHFGPVSRKVLAAMPVSVVLINYSAERLDFLSRLTTWVTFGRGWARRVAQNLRYHALDTGV